jgi:hypothetical protein
VDSKNAYEKICSFVYWTRLNGVVKVSSTIKPFTLLPQADTSIDLQDTQAMSFTYVQGMNVLAAPFLYTMPSEVEAFFCFSKFIEECCPLYVQPTLEGVHRGLKVMLRIFSV